MEIGISVAERRDEDLNLWNGALCEKMTYNRSQRNYFEKLATGSIMDNKFRFYIQIHLSVSVLENNSQRVGEIVKKEKKTPKENNIF
ncbi:hypothetical protein Fmac_012519 [Flemingia macrophylla]|uniref:Uncharacterized protein n=1 Tax=Flemingia macrophylla TaxID=520843 RepID=A0ABD1MRE9_9FABA